MTVTLSELLLTQRMDRAGICRISLHADADIAVIRTARPCMHFVLSGSLQVMTGNQIPVSLATGDFITFPRGDEHRLQGTIASAQARFQPTLLRPADEPASLTYGHSGEQAQLLSCVFNIEPLHLQPSQFILPELIVLRPGSPAFPAFAPPPEVYANLRGPGSGSFACSLIKLLHDQAIRSVLGGTTDRPEPLHLRAPALVMALRLMDGSMAQDWTIASLAQAAGMSRSAFAAMFTAAMDEAPLAYLTRIRLEEAHRLLRHSDLPVNEIAALVGYLSQSAFARTFRRHFGNTPREARRQVAA